MISAMRFFSYKMRQFAPLIRDLLANKPNFSQPDWVNGETSTTHYLGENTVLDNVLLLQEIVLGYEKLMIFRDNYKKLINAKGPEISKRIQNLLDKTTNLVHEIATRPELDDILSQRLDFCRPNVVDSGDFFDYAIAIFENHVIRSFVQRHQNTKFDKTLDSFRKSKEYLVKTFMNKDHLFSLYYKNNLDSLIHSLTGYQITMLEFFIEGSGRKGEESVFSSFLSINGVNGRHGSRPVKDRGHYFWFSNPAEKEDEVCRDLLDHFCTTMEKMSYPALVSVLMDKAASDDRKIFNKTQKWSIVSGNRPKENHEAWLLPAKGLTKNPIALQPRLESLFKWLEAGAEANILPKIILVVTNEWKPNALDTVRPNLRKWRDKDIEFKFLLAQNSGLGLIQLPVQF